MLLLVAAAATALAAWLQAAPTLLLVTLALTGFAFSIAYQRGRVAAFNVAALALIAALATLLVAPDPAGHVQTFSDAPNMFLRDDAVGHLPGPNLNTRATLHVSGTPVYDVVYRTDPTALRVSPPDAGDDIEGCILFFGCSYTFGEGVEDDETMPYAVGRMAGGAYRVRNFGNAGYGPHNMLAAIETGFVARAANCEPSVAIYQAHPHHALRSSGKWWWDKYGPWYVIEEDGSIVRRGSFLDRNAMPEWLANLRASALGQWLLDHEETDEGDVRLFHGIVQRSRDLLAAQYPGIEFHILLWDIGEPYIFGPPWQGQGIHIHPLSRVLPFDRPGWEEEILLPRDVHPTARTHARIAEYVIRAILQREPVDAD